MEMTNMMILGNDTGSLVNHIYSRNANPTPEVGMGATILSWSDRHAGTIISVETKKGVVVGFVVQHDHARRTDSNGMSDAQSYEYAPNPNGCTTEFRLVTRGKRALGQFRTGGKADGQGVIIGLRDKHHDYSF